MEKELEKSLKGKHPEILKEMWGDPKKTCMAWGIECGDGWYKLLDETMSKLDFARKAFTVAGAETRITASQIKEKLGTLSFYFEVESSSDLAKNIVRDIVARAERDSSSVCEVTGQYGVQCSSGGWIKTLCREKAQELSYEPTKPSLAKYWKETVGAIPLPPDTSPLD